MSASQNAQPGIGLNISFVDGDNIRIAPDDILLLEMTGLLPSVQITRENGTQQQAYFELCSNFLLLANDKPVQSSSGATYSLSQRLQRGDAVFARTVYGGNLGDPVLIKNGEPRNGQGQIQICECLPGQIVRFTVKFVN